MSRTNSVALRRTGDSQPLCWWFPSRDEIAEGAIERGLLEQIHRQGFSGPTALVTQRVDEGTQGLALADDAWTCSRLKVGTQLLLSWRRDPRARFDCPHRALAGIDGLISPERGRPHGRTAPPTWFSAWSWWDLPVGRLIRGSASVAEVPGAPPCARHLAPRVGR